NRYAFGQRLRVELLSSKVRATRVDAIPLSQLEEPHRSQPSRRKRHLSALLQPAPAAASNADRHPSAKPHHVPFGQRVSEAHQKTGQANQTTHYGWDRDRLIHTESKEHIHHTVYEPGSFVPLLQLQRKKAGQTNLVKTLGGTAGADSPEQD